jgi:hypothetical protein
MDQRECLRSKGKALSSSPSTTTPWQKEKKDKVERTMKEAWGPQNAILLEVRILGLLA